MALVSARCQGRALLCSVACRLSTYRASRTASSRGAATVPKACAQPQDVAADGTQRFTLRVPLGSNGESSKALPRLDAFVSAALPRGSSRARVTAAIKAGALTVNGRVVTKPSSQVHPGDELRLSLAPPPPMEAAPEDLPLEVVYEDAHVLVVNKAAHMVVHPSAGHASGTLVNAVLHHCGLPPMRVASGTAPPSALLPPADTGDDGMDGEGDDDDDEGGVSTLFLTPPHLSSGAVLRPGIVHRLDKGTSGLLVIAKDAASHSGLCSQFAARSVMRRYHALHIGCPGTPGARVEAPVGRDATNRLRMAVVWAPGARGVRTAASRYQLLDTLAQGGAAHVAWRLETGRTHQVRVHAKYIGVPLLGDPLYGGTPGAAAAALVRCGVAKAPATAFADSLAQDRPCLHAAELGFTHPVTGEALHFEVPPPADFMAALNALRLL